MATQAPVETVKEAVKALFKEAGGHKRVADRFGVSLARAYGFTDAASVEHHISFKRIADITSPQATAAARYLAALTGGVLCLPPPSAPATTMELTGQTAKAHGEALAMTISAIADDVVTSTELAATDMKIDAVICSLFALKRSLRAMAEDEQ